MVDTAVIRQLRRCFSFLSHKPKLSLTPALNTVTKPESYPLFQLNGSSSNVEGIFDETWPIRAKQILVAPPFGSAAPEVLLRRHRGGKVKNKLRNIEKRKKREQNLQRLSSDVKFQ